MPKQGLKSLFSQKSKNAKRMKEIRSQETATETAARQAQERKRIARRRARETPDETATRQKQDRERITRRRAQETVDETAARQEGNRGRMTRRRTQESAAETAARRKKDREYQAQRRVVAAEWRSKMYFSAAFEYDPNHDYESEPAYDGGRRFEECEFCRAKRYPNEKLGLCCGNGRVELQPFRKPPQPLNVLLQGSAEESKNFLNNIKKELDLEENLTMKNEIEIKEEKIDLQERNPCRDDLVSHENFNYEWENLSIKDEAGADVYVKDGILDFNHQPNSKYI